MNMTQEKRKHANEHGVYPGEDRTCLRCGTIIPWHASGEYCLDCSNELNLHYTANNNVADKFIDLWGWEAFV